MKSVDMLPGLCATQENFKDDHEAACGILVTMDERTDRWTDEEDAQAWRR